MERKVIGIEVHSAENPMPKSVAEQKDKGMPEKLKKSTQKFKYNWRLDQMSKPTKITPKANIKEKDQSSSYFIHPSVLNYQCSNRLDHLARPPIRLLTYNLKTYSSEPLKSTINKNLASSWNSMYNFYRKAEITANKRRKSMISLRSKQSKLSKKSDKDLQQWLDRVAKPKKPSPPQRLPPRKHKPIEDLIENIDVLCKPKPTHGYLPGRPTPIPIKKSALEYEMTEPMQALVNKIPERYRKKCAKPLQPGAVKKSALKYTITENVTKLAQPKDKSKTKESDLKEDPFLISPNALKYKPTARIQELAQPSSRK